MATMNVSVTDPMREWVEQRVASGQYSSASDYFRDLIRRDQDAENKILLSVEDIRQSIEIGQSQGQPALAEDVYRRIAQKISALREVA